MSSEVHGSWFSIDGALEPIDVKERTDFRFPIALAEFAIERYSSPEDWVFDPFCGFGTALTVAEQLGRHGVGIEEDPGRATYAAAHASDPGRVIVGRAEDSLRQFS